MMQSFTLQQSVVYQPLSGETYEDAIHKVVDAITDDNIRTHTEQRQAEEARDEKALSDRA